MQFKLFKRPESSTNPSPPKLPWYLTDKWSIRIHIVIALVNAASAVIFFPLWAALLNAFVVGWCGNAAIETMLRGRERRAQDELINSMLENQDRFMHILDRLKEDGHFRIVDADRDKSTSVH